MSALLQLQERILDANAMIKRLEVVATKAQTTPALLGNLRSLVRERERLQQEFEDIASQQEIDLYHYRILPQATERLTITAVADAWKSFQTLFSVVYDSVKNGPKKIARLGVEEIAETALGFGYAYSGSLGVVLTIPNKTQRPLEAGDTMLRKATERAFELAQAKTSDEVAAYARQLGRPVIGALYRWADSHVSNGLGVAIDWRQASTSGAELLVQYSDLERLRNTIDMTSDSTEEEITREGILDAVKVSGKRFTLIVESEPTPLEGTFTDAISENQRVHLPARYSALLRKTTRTKLSTEEEKVSYFLVRLVSL